MTSMIGTKKSVNGTPIGTYIILVLTLGAMTFFGVCSPQGSNRGGIGGAAGQVGSEVISQAEFARAYDAKQRQMRGKFGDNFDPAALKVADQTLEELIHQRVLYLKAQEMGLTAGEGEILKAITSMNYFNDKDGKFSEENFKYFLRSNQMTEASLQDEIRRGLTMQKLQQLMMSSMFVSTKEAALEWRIQESKLNLDYIKIDTSTLPVVVTDEERTAFLKDEKAQEKIKTWYESHQQDYHKPEEVRARHILKAYDGARNADTLAAKRSKDEARKEAERVLALVQADSKNFADLAKKETDEPQGKTNGGDLGFFTREAMVAEFSKAAFELAPGQTSGVVESPFGFHIIQVVAKNPAKDVSLEQATASIVDLLISKEKAPTQAQKLAEEAYAQVKNPAALDALLAKHRLRWEHTGEFSLNTRMIPGLGAKQEVMEQVFALASQDTEKQALIKALPAYYIVKMVDKKQADPAKVDKEQLKFLRANVAFTQSYGFMADLEAKARKEFDKKNAISKNPDYLALDQQRQSAE